MIWEASDPYLYVRTTSDGRVICGGEDEEFTDEDKRNALTPKKTMSLKNKLGKIFLQLDTTAEFAWSGSFGATGYGAADYRRRAGSSAGPCGDGLWLQRHHLFADCLRDRLRVDRQRGGCRCWPLRIWNLIFSPS